MDSNSYDVAVIGGGAAGLSAALVLGRARRRVVVVDGGAPRNAPAAHMQGFLSRDGMPPSELLAVGRTEVERYGVDVRPGQVASVAAGFQVTLEDGDVLSARRLLVATGVGDDVPDVPGVSERWGRDLLHCPYCHGWEVRDQPLGLLAGTPGSVLHALLLRQWSDDVVFFRHSYDLGSDERRQLKARGISVEEGLVRRLVIEDDQLAGVEIEGGRFVARAAVFVRPVIAPHDDGLLRSLGCDVHDSGFVQVDGTGRTSNVGVWAAGNVADPRAQVITAAGAGSAAAIAINADLLDEDVAVALQHDATTQPRSAR